jgi:hypothetical protein
MVKYCGVLLFLCGAGMPYVTTVTPLPGWDIFEPLTYGSEHRDLHVDELLGRGLWDPYRYGPSIIREDDGTLDAWFSSPGGRGADGEHQWDWIRHRASEDGGKTWGPETLVLKPTPDSRDRQSVCDPGVIRFGGYYYLGVTSVEDPEGHGNEVFVARSESPIGPYKKWNGKGWGGSPVPLIPFDGPSNVWGAGEPSFVLKDDTLFIYYTLWSETDKGETILETRVCTAPATGEDWPNRLLHHGAAFHRLTEEGYEDSADVKYLPDAGVFVALSVANRITERSCVAIRESCDGIHFGPPRMIKENIRPKCHNLGISGTESGHIRAGERVFLAYAYAAPGDQGVHWHTYWQPVSISFEE